MGLVKVSLGDYVTTHKEQCGIPNLHPEEVSGINRDKTFFEPSTQVGSDTSKYQIVPPGYFACNLMHVGRDVVVPLAYNQTSENKHVSPAYTVFKFRQNNEIDPRYFLILMSSQEKDRYCWFHTDASVRDGMSWSDFCDLELNLPPIEIQRKYVAIYEFMRANQKCYEESLEDLKLACDAELEQLIASHEQRRIGDYIHAVDDRNSDNALDVDSVRGISIQKKFIATKAKMDGVSLSSYKLVRPGSFSYVPTTSRNGGKITLALNDAEDTYIVSSSYEVFTVNNARELNPSYLMLFFARREFDRYARFNSWGSAREAFDWSEMQSVSTPIPEIGLQDALANLYEAYRERVEINERLKAQLAEMCPILIKGSIDEAKQL